MIVPAWKQHRDDNRTPRERALARIAEARIDWHVCGVPYDACLELAVEVEQLRDALGECSDALDRAGSREHELRRELFIAQSAASR